MSTTTWTNFWDMTSDAGFRVIGLAMSTGLQAVNPSLFTKTTDTGQINWVTVTKPVAVNTAAGYEIYEFSDGISNIFYKIEYGTSTATAWSIWITTGTGTNGAGTITGVQVARIQVGAQAPTSTVTNYTSYACCVVGGVWWNLGVGMLLAGVNGSGAGMATTLRSCDSSGNATGDGYINIVALTSAGTTAASCINLGTGTVVTSTTGNWALVPFGITSSTYSNSGTPTNQSWRFEFALPQTFTTALGAAYIASEAGAATTNVYALVGSTTHTFYFTGASALRSAQSSNNYGFILVYE